MNDSASSTRENLLDATRRCVRDRGLVGATSREITAAAGANLAAITYHFGSKDQLIAEALFGEIERRVVPALGAFEQDGSPAQTMLAVVQTLLAEFERSRNDAVVYLEALVMATHDPEYRDRARALFATIGDRLTAVIVELTDTGVIPTWVDARAMTSLLLAVANGIVLQTQLDPDGADQAALATQFAALLLAASNPP